MEFLLGFVIYGAIVLSVAFISKKVGYKLPLTLGILTGLASIYFKLSQPSVLTTHEEELTSLWYSLFSIIGLMFTIAFLTNVFLIIRSKRKSQSQS